MSGKTHIDQLFKEVNFLEEQGLVGEDASLRLRRLLKKLDRAVARQDRISASMLVAKICTVLLEVHRG